MKKILLALGVVALAAIPAGAQGLSPSVVPGAVLGGVAGAIIGNNSSGRHTGGGAAIGAVAGALLGAAYDQGNRTTVVYSTPPQPVYCPPPAPAAQVVYVQQPAPVYVATYVPATPPPQVIVYSRSAPAPVVVYQQPYGYVRRAPVVIYPSLAPRGYRDYGRWR